MARPTNKYYEMQDSKMFLGLYDTVISADYSKILCIARK